MVDKALFAERLRVALAKKRWSAAGLARRLKPPSSRESTAQWARGLVLPSGAYAIQLPGLLGVETDWLFPEGDAQVADSPSNDKTVKVPRLPGRRPAELEKLLGLVRDALLGAVDRALARDHELEQTRRGYRILGDAFLDLGLRLQQNDVDTHELLSYARELQKRGGHE